MVYVRPDRDHISIFVPRKARHLCFSRDFVFDGRTLKSANALDLVHTLAVGYHMFGRDRVNLSSVLMQQKYGSGYARYVEWAQSEGFMRLVGRHYNGRFSRQYALCEDAYVGLSRHKLTDARLVRVYNRLSARRAADLLVGKHDVLRHQHGLLVRDMTRFQIDADVAREMLRAEGISEDTDRYNRLMWVVESVRDGQHFWTTDEYGRLHTNFTILKRVIRQGAVRCGGMPVDEVDIVNSQPLFLTLLMRREGVADTYRDFVADVMRGVVYENLANYSGLSRKKAKKLCFRVLYGANTESPQNRFFRNVYPGVWQWIKAWKHRQGSYQSLARQLQRDESHWMYAVLMPALRQRMPETPFFTVHDSVYFPRDFRKTVSAVFGSEMSRLLTDGI